MSEQAAIERVDEPVTTDRIASDLRGFGVTDGDVLIVHAAMSSLGWVAGGPQAVVDALQDVITASGTIVMPTFTGQYTDPAGWSAPPVPATWYEPIRAAMPPFRPRVTPTRGMGAIPECFRTYPDVSRSLHPEVSFAAWGADADAIVTDHELDYGLGNGSPLARLYDRDASILLIGVGHDVNSSLHLAEYRADIDPPTVSRQAPIRLDGREQRVEYETIELSTDDFTELGADFEAQYDIDAGTVGASTVKRLSQRTVVDFAVDWFETHRSSPQC